jgi:hypothetical protein
MYVSLEPLHGQIYFVPEAGEEYEAIGVDAFPMGYFASRSAAMGAVSAGVVAATFFNFNPSLVASAIPAAWDRAAPAVLIEARFRAVDRGLRRLLGDDATGSDVVEAAELARRAAEGCTAHGRPLYAGHAELDWPDDPLLVLWHAVTLLREFRGDGHIAALVDAEIDGCEALVTHAAMGDGLLSRRVLQMTRAWSDDDWSAAEARLRGRRLLDDEGALTDAGRAHRQAVEDRTDELAAAPWAHLGDDGCDRLRQLGGRFSQAIIDAGTFGRRRNR